MNAISPLTLAYALLLGTEAPTEGSPAAEVEQSLRNLNRAFAKRDVIALRRLFADDHVSITPYSGMMDREAHLNDLPAWQIAEVREDDMRVTMLGKDTARVTYLLTIRGTYRGKTLPARSRAVSIWVNRHSRWQEASYQETPVESEPARDAAGAEEVVRLARILSEAFVKRDAATVRRLLADDQVAVFGRGRPETKAEQLRKLADLEVARASLHDIKAVPISRDVVAVSFRMEREGAFKGRPLSAVAYGLAVWVNREGRWQQVTYQETAPQE